jgi:hypothetical protein
MAKNKYDFIKEILESKKMTSTQRERVLLLAKDEIEKDSNTEKDLHKRVKKLEEPLTSNVNKKSIQELKKFLTELLGLDSKENEYYGTVNER